MADKLTDITSKISSFTAANGDMKATAERAFVAYSKNVYLAKEKSIFNINSINLDKLAKSWGLVVKPRYMFDDYI